MSRNLQQEFEDAFNRLDAQQQTAVLETEGPVRVIAGPGSGKTEVLCLRIGKILQMQDCHPSSILCLTFSRAAVETIRERLWALIGTTADMVEIHTFHSFSHKLLREKGGQILRNKKLISRAQQSMVLSKLLTTQFAEEDPRQLKPAPAALISSYLNIFNHLGREGISLYDLQDEANEWSPVAIAFTEQLAELQEAYTRMLEERKLMSFDDLLLEAILLISEQPELHAALREQYQYLLLDEFQDTNPLQLQLIRLLAAGESSPNLFAVGDENQSIYRFQGAGTHQFNWMEEHFKVVRTLNLSSNYRSKPALVEAFRRLAAKLSNSVFEDKNKTLVEHVTDDQTASITCRIYRNSDEEAKGTALLIQQMIEQSSGTTALLARKHQELQLVAGYLHQLGIPFRYNRQENNLLESHFGKCLHYTLQFLHLRGLDNYMSEGYLYHGLLHKREGRKLLRLFMEQRQQTQIQLFEWLGGYCERLSYLGDWYPLIQALLWRCDEPLNRETLTILKSAVILGLREAPSQAEERAWTGWLEQFLETDKQKTLRSLAAMIGYQVQQNIPIPVPVDQHLYSETALILSTIHAAKGMGFRQVILMGCQSSNWEASTPPYALPIPEELRGKIYPEAASIDDLYRLLYVGCTRAEQELHCSYHEEVHSSGVSLLLQPLIDQGMVLQDYRAKEFKMPEVETYRVEYDDEWNNLVQDRCARYALSPTGTHSWKECQNRFFITQLIKVPGLGSEATAFGNIMHDALKLIGKSPQVQQDSVWIEQTINRLFKSYWFRFFPVHLDAYRRYALWLLPRYLAASPLPDQPGLIEKSFQFVGPSGMRIKGILDRVEIDGDKVRMVDYKTGRRKDSLEQFQDEENPGSAYWRQGMIYAGIMKSVYPDASTFEFAFHYLEDDKPVEVLDVKPHDGLNSWLHAVWTEIMALRLRKSCGDPECIYCLVMQSDIYAVH
jgi:DNA helicase-2/ATP-dependent DNA helicase PcrA